MRFSLCRLSQKLLCIHNIPKWPPNVLFEVVQNCIILPDFITPAEETDLLKEIEPHMKRLRYEKSHWDNAIHLYREREQRKWNEQNEKVLRRIATTSFPPEAVHLSYIHILDLHQDGHIKPHIDSVRYCGNVISGVSLLSDSVMRLRHKDDKDTLVVDMLLKRRSLYKLTGVGRYDFTHEILPQEESEFDGTPVQRARRISVICRDVPQREKAEEKLQYQPLEPN